MSWEKFLHTATGKFFELLEKQKRTIASPPQKKKKKAERQTEKGLGGKTWIYTINLTSFVGVSVWSKVHFFNIYLFLAVLGLHCHTQPFSSCRKPGALSSCGAQAFHRAGFSHCGAQALGAWASEVMARGLSNCDTHAQLSHGMWDPSSWTRDRI